MAWYQASCPCVEPKPLAGAVPARKADYQEARAGDLQFKPGSCAYNTKEARYSLLLFRSRANRSSETKAFLTLVVFRFYPLFNREPL